ncbi:MAG: MFS transporter, partial [Desulfobacteraceae bacterium]
GFGHILGVLCGGFLYNGFNRLYNGWGFEKGALFFVSAAAMLASVIPIFLIPEGGTSAGGRDESREGRPGGVPTSGGFSKRGLFVFILFLAAMAFVNFGRNSIAMINSQYLTLESGFHLSSQALSHLINAYSAAMIVSGFILGRLIIREKHALLLMIGTAIAVLSSVLYFLASALGWIYCANILGGSGEVIIFAGSYAIASRLIPPQSRARLFGYFNATFFLSWGVAGTIILGPLIDYLIGAGQSQIYAYKSSYLIAAAITLIGLLLLAALTYIVIPRAAGRSAAAANMTMDGKEMEG